MNGRIEDILSLDLDEVERTLPDLYLPRPIKKLWSDYFAKRRSSNDSVNRCNSASFPVFINGATSANPSGFDESTAPSDNLASIQRNWIRVSPSDVKDRTNPSAEPEDTRVLGEIRIDPEPATKSPIKQKDHETNAAHSKQSS
jgi:hypothetical protein